MSYYRLLKLKKEPFSSSPDPLFLYQSRECRNFLMKLEISIRLRRGLNVLVGEIGTGKTTLGRYLMRRFEAEKDNVVFYLILDPSFESEKEFLSFLLNTFSIPRPKEFSLIAYKNAIQNFLIEKGAKENKTIVLLIDEAQKLTANCMEVLREFLNFETNEYKLLQLLLIGQMELLERIRNKPNFMDRVNEWFFLHPMNHTEAKAMIEHRLAIAGLIETPRLFTRGAFKAIYEVTGGYPRKIVLLCHHALITLLVQRSKKIHRGLIKDVFKKHSIPRAKSRRYLSKRFFLSAPSALFLTLFIFFLVLPTFPSLFPSLLKSLSSSMQQEEQDGIVTENNRSTSDFKISVETIKKPRGSIAGSSPKTTSMLTDLIETGNSETHTSPIYIRSKSDKEHSKTSSENFYNTPFAVSTQDGESMTYLLSKNMTQGKGKQKDIVWSVKKGDNLYNLALKIYGRVDYRILSLVKHYNPGLKNVDNLRIGQIIRFPDMSY